jgi:hypothetical protein
MSEIKRTAGAQEPSLPAASEKRGPVRPPGRLGDQHHQLAYFIASGRRWLEISRETGITMSHIQKQHGRPEFRELVDAYKEKIASGDGKLLDFDSFREVQKLRGASLRLALEEQQWRLLEQPESISNRELQEMIADHSDRLDMGKTAKHLHGHVDLANNLALARQRRLQLSAPGSQSPDDDEAVAVDHSGNGKRNS